METRDLLTAALINVIKDDYGNDAGAATPIQVGSTISGKIEYGRDEDWFRLDISDGQSYRITTSLGSLTDTILTLYGGDGTTRINENDDDPYSGTLASRLDFTASNGGVVYVPRVGAGADGSYFIKVKAYESWQTGSYQLKVISTNSNVDDYGNDSNSAATIQIGQPVTGNIEVGGDQDWFKFTAFAGQQLRLQTSPNSLPIEVVTLRFPNGSTRISYNYPGANAAPWDFTASHTGTYLIKITGGNNQQTGTYELSVSNQATSITNLQGQWWMSGYYGAQIQQSGSRLTFINERGERSSGAFADYSHVGAGQNWGGIQGTLVWTNTGLEIRWSNDTVWTRNKQQAPNLAGTWWMSGAYPTSIRQDANNGLTFINERGQSANGIFMNETQVVAYGWNGLRGDIVSATDGLEIRWRNGTVWTRQQRTPPIAGTWWFNGNTSVQYTTSGLLFTNEHGARSGGYWLDATHVRATSWGNLVGEVSQESIVWQNGTTWTRRS